MVFKELLVRDSTELKARIFQNLNKLARLHVQIRGLTFLDDLPELATQIEAYKRSQAERTQERELKIWELVEKANKEINEQDFINFGQEAETTIFALEHEVHKFQKLTGSRDPALNIQVDRYNAVIGIIENIRRDLHSLQKLVKELHTLIRSQLWTVIIRPTIKRNAYEIELTSLRNRIKSNLQELEKIYSMIEALAQRPTPA